MSTKRSLARFPEMITLCAQLTLTTGYSLGLLIAKRGRLHCQKVHQA
ncbi:MAG: hypothetical protein HRT52_01570 [Colwellia sp.]|nr:hypothetical protein [Colwellia sp.]NQZ79679.1 hypothetical protein [Colwellia sp.]